MTLKFVLFVVLLFGIADSDVPNTTESEFWWQQLGSKVSQITHRLEKVEHDQEVSRQIKKSEQSDQEEKILLRQISNLMIKLDTKLEHRTNSSEILQITRRLEKLEQNIQEQKILWQEFSNNRKNLSGPVASFQKSKSTSGETLPRDCLDVRNRGFNKSDVYIIRPQLSPREFSVQCDMDTRGGGWTQVVRRIDGSVDFNQKWKKYKDGFGILTGEFWLGLDYLYYLTAEETNELLIEFSDPDKKEYFAHFDFFGIGDESDGYYIKLLSGFTGNADDKLTYHSGQKFSTRDKDQDSNSNNCAIEYGGGWWHKACHTSHLTGKYVPAQNGYGISWHPYNKIKSAKMMIRSRRG